MPSQRPTIQTSPTTPPPLDAKLVLLGSQGVGKTSLITRYLNPLPPSHNPKTPLPPNPVSTIGASFITKRIADSDTSTPIRLQIWDTAGQERFRSISRLYYRGAHVGLLCYDITDEASWEDMKGWLRELRQNCSEEDGLIIHVVGTKSDIVALDPSKRQVPFEKTIAYVAEQLCGASETSTPAPMTSKSSHGSHSSSNNPLQSPGSKRSSGFWGTNTTYNGDNDINTSPTINVWDSCHEVNSTTGEGIEEVFRVIARKLVEQRTRKEDAELARLAQTPGMRSDTGDDYFAYGQANNTGSFRLGHGDKRRSWLGLPTVGIGVGDNGLDGSGEGRRFDERDVEEARRRGRCC